MLEDSLWVCTDRNITVLQPPKKKVSEGHTSLVYDDLREWKKAKVLKKHKDVISRLILVQRSASSAPQVWSGDVKGLIVIWDAKVDSTTLCSHICALDLSNIGYLDIFNLETQGGASSCATRKRVDILDVLRRSCSGLAWRREGYLQDQSRGH